MRSGLASVCAVGAVLAVGACRREAKPRYAILDAGTGEVADDFLIPLRPGYFAVAPEVEGDPGYAFVPRTTRVEGGDGAVLQFGLTGENLPVWDVVLDATPHGIVARVAGGQILDPPWLILPAEPRDGMAWQVIDKKKNVLANGAITRGDPIDWPRAEDPSAPPISTPVRPWILSFDVAHAAEGTQEALDLGHLTIEPWEATIRRPASSAPVRPQAHFRDFNPLSPGGGALTWVLVEGEGFVAETALIPSEAIETPVLEPLELEEISTRDVDASGDFDHFGDVTDSHPWNITVNRADPRFPGTGDLVNVWTRAVVAFGAMNSQIGWDTVRTCRGFDLGSETWRAEQYEADRFQFRCPDASHFEVGDDGVASAPTWLGYTPFDAQDLFWNPLDPQAESWGFVDLIGAFHGVYLGEDGAVRGVARELLRPQITHIAELVPNAERDYLYFDEDFPAVGNQFAGNRVIDHYAERIGEPVMGEVLRTIALRPEGSGGVPLIVDAWPFLGHATLRPAPEGSPAAAYLPDFAVDAVLLDPITVVYEGQGRRKVTVALAHAGIHELDVSGGALRWRSLGRPELPDRNVVVGAWRDGEEVVVVTREGIVATGLYAGIPAYTDAQLRFFRMPVEEGDWEPLPSHLYPGVDDLPRRVVPTGPELPGTGLDRVVCAPAGVELDEVRFEGRETLVVPTDDRCALALRGGFTRDPASAQPLADPATLRFHRSDLGDVLVRGRGSLTPLGGRHLVPRDRWDALTNPGLPVAEGLHYGSLAAPHPTDDVFAGGPVLLDDPSGQGTWVISVDSLADCAQLPEPLSPCFELRYAPADGGITQAWEVVSTRAELDPDAPLEDWQRSRGPWFPAADVGLYVADGQVEANSGYGLVWLGPDGSADLGPVCVAQGATSPSGPRPPFLLDGEGPWGPLAPCATADGRAAPGVTANDGLTNVALPAPGHRELGLGERDPWRGGIVRPVALDPESAAFLDRHGGPDQVGVEVLGGDDWERRRKLFLRAGQTATPWILVQTDAFQQPTAVLAAGVGPPLQPGSAPVRAFDLPFLPHDAAVGPAPECDGEREVARADGTCVCAWEHELVGGVCTPILGGSYLPAPSCAAIQAERGVAPEFAFIDPDGTFQPVEPQNAFAPHRMRCRDDGLTELAPDPRSGVLPVAWDTPLVGAFDLSWTVTATWPDAWVALYEAPRVGGARSSWGAEPIAALEGDRPDAVELPQQHRLRVRSEVLDFGPMLPGLYRWTRDEDGMMQISRDGVVVASLPLDVSPLYVMEPAPGMNVAFAGDLCTPEGRTYGEDGCVLPPQTCEERGHECGNGDDGAFGRLECGDPAPGVECAFARNRCVPDVFEPNDGPQYPVSGELGRGVAWGEWSADLVDLTLDTPADLDRYLFQGGDRAAGLANEFVVTVDSVPGVSHTLTVGVAVNTTMGFSAGECLTSCAIGAATTMDPHVGPTFRPPGCVIEGEGPLTASIRVSCPTSVPDADWGDYLVTVRSDDPSRAACVPYELTARIDVASAFP